MKQVITILFALIFSLAANAQKVLFLDAGHGGKDKGAISKTGIEEAVINAAFVNELKIAAEAKGLKVVLLSNEKENVPLAERTEKVKSYNLANGETACLLSIHANFSADPTKSGIEVMVLNSEERSEGSMEIAKKLEKALNATLLEKRLNILKVPVPAVLIETGYISNAEDESMLINEDNRSLIIDKILTVF